MHGGAEKVLLNLVNNMDHGFKISISLSALISPGHRTVKNRRSGDH